jgi:NCS1 family nucleobase:cation symporter-1
MRSASTPKLDAADRLDKLYEFDREPVSENRLLGPGYFAGSFAGEHVAATEFVIGVLFVNWGASVRDVFLGLAIGNVFAVLTWTLICAPIAVETRLTLYWYLRRIGGPFMTVIYNVLNAVLFCILAGCMITVSASAVRIPFRIPAQVNWYPDDPRFVMVALGVGAVVVTVAVLGFKKLAVFSAVCSPWMFLMFVAGAVVMLPRLAEQAGAGEGNPFSAFWDIANDVVWTGTTPDGSPPLGFWKIVAFAWICNLAMHGGLSDMALFRYSRKARYGLFSAFGMFLGHYLAWICAGMMGVGAALLLNSPLASLDSGEVAYQALGWAGVFAVIAAGWTTANPTLYRAGLALQAITPNWSRARVTLIAGAATTLIACFPFVFTRLLDFVGIYGLLLAPAGAIVLTEHWIFPRIGFTRYWASYRKVLLNWPAMLAWIAAIGVGFALERAGILHLFYLFVPVYTLTAVLYIALASVAGAKDKYAGAELQPTPSSRSGMSTPAAAAKPGGSAVWTTGAVALAALLVCLAAPISFAMDGWDGFAVRHEPLKLTLAAATLVYFVFGIVFYRLRSRE